MTKIATNSQPSFPLLDIVITEGYSWRLYSYILHQNRRLLKYYKIKPKDKTRNNINSMKGAVGVHKLGTVSYLMKFIINS